MFVSFSSSVLKCLIIGVDMSENKFSATAISLFGADLLRTGRNDEALELFARAVKQEPENAQWWNHLGEALERADRIEEALTAYEAAVKFQPDSHEYLNNCGVMFAMLGNLSEAESAFLDALKLSPDYANAKLNLRDLRLRRTTVSSDKVETAPTSEFFTERELKSLIGRLKLAASQSPADWSILLRLSKLLDRSGDLQEALKLLKRIVKYDQGNIQAWLGLAELHMKLGQKQLAISTFEKVISFNPGDYNGYLKLGDALMAAHHLVDATEAIRIAVELAPENADCWRTWAQVLELAQDGSCYYAYLRAAELARFDSELWYIVGTLARNKGERDSAISALQQSVELSPKLNKAWNTLGRIYEDMGDRIRAEEIYRNIISYDAQAPKAWNNLGVLLSYRGDKEGAEEAFRRSIAIAPDFVNPWYNLRDLLLSRGDRVGAAEARKRAADVSQFSSNWAGDE
jgi:Flp pilus assembly protein TadD